MEVDSPGYQDHHVFNTLTQLDEFYGRLADSVFLWTSIGTRALGNIDSYLFSSIQGTLSSIQFSLRDGRINDARALLRMYYDSVVINIWTNLYLDENFSLEEYIVEKVDKWINGGEKLPRFESMVKKLEKSPRLSHVTNVLSPERYVAIRKRCNDHTHYNFYRTLLLNCRDVNVRTRQNEMDALAVDVKDLFVLHLAYLFTIREHYMSSSDFVDYLEVGIVPEPNSQYWVAPFVQQVFDDVVKPHRPDVASVLIQTTMMEIS